MFFPVWHVSCVLCGGACSLIYYKTAPPLQHQQQQSFSCQGGGGPPSPPQQQLGLARGALPPRSSSSSSTHATTAAIAPVPEADRRHPSPRGGTPHRLSSTWNFGRREQNLNCNVPLASLDRHRTVYQYCSYIRNTW